MITPEYLSRMLTLLEVHKELEESILRDIIRRIVKTDFTITDTASYQAEILQNSGMCFDEIAEAVAKEASRQKSEVEKAFLDANTEVFNYDDTILELAGIEPAAFKTLSPQMAKIYEAALKDATSEVLNLTRTTASMSQAAFINCANVAQMQIASGGFTYQQAIKEAIISASKQGVNVLYPTGHSTSLDAAVRRAVLTGVNQTCCRISEMRAREYDVDIMEITAHAGARPEHALWQGRLVSRSGRKGYLTLENIGYGTVTGFMGANCRHDWNMFFEGVSKRAYTDEELDALKNATVTYDGEEIPEWKAVQKQRGMERSIKALKRELVGIDEAMKNTEDNELLSELKTSFEKKVVRLKGKESELANFCKQTGLKRDRSREQMFCAETEKGIKAWTKSVSSKAVQSFEKKKLPNYKKAVVSDEKLTDYALNKNHPVGKDKAIAFEKYLGYNIANKDLLIEEIRNGIKSNVAIERKHNGYGKPFSVRMKMKGANGKYAWVKSGWIFDEGSDFPRLTSVYVDE